MNCPTCGSAVPAGAATCPICGSPLSNNSLGSNSLGSNSQTLPPGTTLAGGKYRLDKVLGQGGFGITYLASQTQLGARVAIKELFPSGSTRQGGKSVLPPAGTDPAGWARLGQDFTAEGRTVARFNHPDIVRVMDLFEENATAYLVMEFLEGQTLGSAIEQRGPLPPEEVINIARRILGALSVVHGAGMLHRDIKPDNVYLDKAGRTVLIDFGSARNFAAGQRMSHTRLVTPGYAPLEQYSSAANFGPYTDIYALGATLYHALTGHPPTPATDRTMGTPLAPLPPNTPAPLREVIGRSLAIKITDRPQSTQEVLALLKQAPATPASPPSPAAARPAPPQPQHFPTAPGPQQFPSPQAPQPQPSRRRGPGCGCLLPLLLLGGAAMYAVNTLGSLFPGSVTTTEQTQPVPEPTSTEPTLPESTPTEAEPTPDTTQTEPTQAAPAQTGTPNTTTDPDGWEDNSAPIDLGLPGGEPSEAAQEPTSEAPTQPAGTQQGGATGEQTPSTGAPTSAAPTSEIIVTSAEANLRAQPDKTSDILGTLSAGTTVQVLRTQEDWYEVQTADGERGWLSPKVAGPLASDEALQSFLDAAQQGGDVQVPAGVYRLPGPLVLTQSTRLIGAGRDQTRLISAAGDTVLTTQGGDLTVQDLTVQWAGSGPGRVVVAEGGHVTLRGARLTGGVRDEARNELGSGLWLARGAQGDVQGSELIGNAYGAYVSDTAQLGIATSNLDDNSLSGLIFLDQSGGEVRGSSFDRNGVHGVTVQGQANPVIVDSTVRDNRQRGVTVQGQAQPTIKRITAAGNGDLGIGVQDDAHPQLRDNTLTNNAQSGIAYSGRAGGQASGNTLTGNLVGIAVKDQAAPTLLNNTIRSSRDAGLTYAEQAGGSASNNTIEGSAKPGISLWGEAQPTLSGNVVQGGAQSGLVFVEQAGGSASGNKVLGNALNGLVVSDQAAPEVRDNTFQDNGEAALVYKGEAGGRVSGNTCQGNGSDTIELQLTDLLGGPDLTAATCSVNTQVMR